MAESKQRANTRKRKQITSLAGQRTLFDNFLTRNKSHNTRDGNVHNVETQASTEQTADTAPESIADDHSDHDITNADTLDNRESSPLTALSSSLSEQLPPSSPVAVEQDVGAYVHAYAYWSVCGVLTSEAEEQQPKKLHPLFERTSFFRRKGEPLEATSKFSDVIDITDDDTPVRRKSKRLTAPQCTDSTVVPHGIHLPSSPAPTLSDSTITNDVIELSSDDSEQSHIFIENSPIRPRLRPFFNPPQLLHPFLPVPSSDLSNPKKRRKLLHEDQFLQAVFPDGTSQHVRGPQSIYVATYPPFGRRDKGKGRADTSPTELPSLGFLRSKSPSPEPSLGGSSDKPLPSSPSRSREDFVASIPASHRTLYPAISRFFDSPSSHHSSNTRHSDLTQLYWNEKWRPRRAVEVLGNEQNACYLRDWMNALQLHFDQPSDKPSGSQKSSQGSQKSKVGSQSTSQRKRKAGRPEVLREVTHSRKRQRCDELDWIVDDDEVSAEELGYSSDDGLHSSSFQNNAEFSIPKSSPENINPVPSKPFTFGGKICNTILLSGPPGSGKTAAVYACAEELGWEVFEVYPGIGKRSAANLENLIGDVGKNHLVQQPRSRLEGEVSNPGGRDTLPSSPEGSSTALSARDKKIKMIRKPPLKRLRRKAPEDDLTQLIGDEHVVDVAQLVSNTWGASTSDGMQTDGTFRQSIVLFEEVDVLFREDIGFWPAVVKFIKECKRPVIMTCNDLSLVPTDDLPLQDIVTFMPPPLSVTISYIQSLCLAEGGMVDRDEYLDFLVTSDGTKLPTCHGAPVELSDHSLNEEKTYPSLDLRRSINQCQLLFPRSPAPSLPFYLMMSNTDIEALMDTAPDQPAEVLNASAVVDLQTSLDALRLLERGQDTLSLLDAYLMPSRRFIVEVSEDLSNSQIGYISLEPVSRIDLPVDSESYTHDIQIAGVIIGRSPKVVKGNYISNVLNDTLLRPADEPYQTQMQYALGRMVPRVVFLLHQHIVHLDYEPWIRYMVKVDEEDMASKTTVGRQTKNSRGRDFRFLDMDEEKKGILSRTGFGIY
ncbi:hypothetical protein EW146_g5684 [Bondarzewia mesenterica]|uniref:ATPase AAA-type core domain-containing protein n=1 Tax=Bondarzewia mesenterica TaxID=1095465 RepID=A0A4S4LQR5_9AGAM|nr:hypothetical protein EW146_g5684 [Bondarzewia mesenterica]